MLSLKPSPTQLIECNPPPSPLFALLCFPPPFVLLRAPGEVVVTTTSAEPATDDIPSSYNDDGSELYSSVGRFVLGFRFLTPPRGGHMGFFILQEGPLTSFSRPPRMRPR